MGESPEYLRGPDSFFAEGSTELPHRIGDRFGRLRRRERLASYPSGVYDESAKKFLSPQFARAASGERKSFLTPSSPR
jgi:hypothetical protein